MRFRDESWGRLRTLLTRDRGNPERAGDGSQRRARKARRLPALQVLDVARAGVAQTAHVEPAAGAPGRWVRAVDGELVNLDGCDYVAVEQEGEGSYIVIARMHGSARNWVLARYADRGDATRAQDWLAGHLQAWRLDRITTAAEPDRDGGAGQA